MASHSCGVPVWTQADQPQVGGSAVGMKLSYVINGNYCGLDRIGRTLSQTWTVGGSPIDG